MITSNARHLLGAGRTPGEVPLVSGAHTAHVGQLYGVRGADALNPTDSGHGVSEMQPGDDGQAEIGNDAPADLGSYDLRPIYPPPLGHPLLDFRPTFLKPLVMIALMMLFLLVGLSIGILVYRAGSDNQFHTTNDYVFIAQFIPSIIGTITVLLFKTMVCELRRMTPYIAMADHGGLNGGAKADRSIDSKYFPPVPLGLNTRMIYFAYISLILTSFLVAVKTALLSTQRQSDGWVVTVRKGPAWWLVGGYALMTLFTLTTAIWLWSCETGLKWDPVSLADQLALFNNPNTLSYFEELELKHNKRASKVGALKNARFRLGYWHIGQKVWYGIGVINSNDLDQPATKQIVSLTDVQIVDQPATKQMEPALRGTGTSATCGPLPNNKAVNTHEPEPLIHSQTEIQHMSSPDMHQEHNPDSGSNETAPADATKNTEDPAQAFCSCKSEKCEHNPYRHSPWVVFSVFVFCMIIVGSSFVVCLYALASGHVLNGFSLENTWYWHNESSNGNLSTTTNFNQTLHPGDHWWDSNFSPDRSHNLLLYALVFRSLPTQLAGVITNFMSIVDMNHCFIQPFVEMSKAPAPASKTLLLEYFAASPLQVPLTAWENGHLKVAWFSALNTISPLFPILVGGMFSMINTGERVYFGFSIPAFSIVFTFLAVYFISLYFAWPTKDRLLPRWYYNLAALMALCHKSQFLQEPEFDISDPKTTKQHMVSRIFLRGDSYSFGTYNGTDGKKHLGFDVAENVVEWVSSDRTDLRRRGLGSQQQKDGKSTEAGSTSSRRMMEDEKASGYV